MGDEAKLPDPGPLFGLTAYAQERERMWREREQRASEKEKWRSRKTEGRATKRQFTDTMASSASSYRSTAKEFVKETSNGEGKERTNTSMRVPGSPVR